jgi:hypothetical protein
MKIRIYQVSYQFYLIPYIKITYSRFLNGNYELILGWLDKQITLEL